MDPVSHMSPDVGYPYLSLGYLPKREFLISLVPLLKVKKPNSSNIQLLRILYYEAFPFYSELKSYPFITSSHIQNWKPLDLGAGSLLVSS